MPLLPVNAACLARQFALSVLFRSVVPQRPVTVKLVALLIRDGGS